MIGFVPCNRVESFGNGYGINLKNDEECIANETEMYSYLDATMYMSYYGAYLYYNDEYFVSDKYGD